MTEWKEIEEICLCHLGELFCALDIREVLEISLHTKIAPVPQSLPFISGVANLRGQIVPIIDLARRLDLPPSPTPSEQVLFVGDGDHKVGLLVDEVDTVLNVDPNLYDPTMNTPSQSKQRFFKGVYKLKEQLVALLNLEEILNINDSVKEGEKK